MRLVHRAWALIGEGGIDQVIDHVLLDEAIRLDAKDALAGAFWVGVHCSVEEVVRREAARGDRYVGFASGTSAVVHDEMTYDFIVDTTHATSTECAERLFDALAMDPRWDSGR
jgi:chloramphenicol 3-O phosphotransferase